MALGYAVFVVGAIFYAFSISNLLTEISNYPFHAEEENFARSFLRIVDVDSNGIISKKEMKDFAPCTDYEGKKIKKVFGDYGRKADINDLTLDLDSKTSKSYLTKSSMPLSLVWETLKASQPLTI